MVPDSSVCFDNSVLSVISLESFLFEFKIFVEQDLAAVGGGRSAGFKIRLGTIYSFLIFRP